jgi:phosphatidylglycerol:prolipoprotein diacylglycerol transferase
MNTPDVYFPNIGIKIDHLSRVAFSIFGYDIYKYGAIICFGVILAIIAVHFEAKRTGQNPDSYTDFVFWGLLAGITGARLYYMIFHTGSLKGFFAIREGGLAIYGGILGAVIAVIVYTRVKKLSLLLFTDTAAMSLLIGQIIGRWGNFVNREAFGGPTESLFALAYKAEQVSGLAVGNDGTAVYNSSAVYPLHSLNGTDYIWVHPTFLYESCWNLLLLGVIFFTRKHKKFDGQLTATYFLGYGVGRFLIESMRTDQLKLLGLPVSMVLSAVLSIAALVFIIYKLVNIHKNKAV